VRIAAAALAALLAAASAGAATHRVGALKVDLEEGGAFQGGLIDVRISSRRPLRGSVYAVLDGRRCPAHWSGGRLRALVPVPVTMPPGRTPLGIEVRTARGRQRFPLSVTIAERVHPASVAELPEAARALVADPAAVLDGRRLQLLLRTQSPRQEWSAPFHPPVGVAPSDTFGVERTYAGAGEVESKSDAVFGEYHRGLDYDVAPGTAVAAPAGATVLFAGDLAITGRTVVLDHGRGLVSVLAHLAAAAVREGQRVEAGTVIGAAGQSGLALHPHLHWAVYLHGVPIDPRVTGRL
jgi:murein DD-endopeptidase MepM/ murein hydrolase activator NlpD